VKALRRLSGPTVTKRRVATVSVLLTVGSWMRPVEVLSSGPSRDAAPGEAGDVAPTFRSASSRLPFVLT